MKAKIGKRLIQTLKPKGAAYDVWDTEVGGLALRVLPSGSMAYSIRYRDAHGRRVRLKLGDASVLSPTQARDLARAALVDKARGEDPAKLRRAGRAHTLKSYLEQVYTPWLTAHRKAHREILRSLKTNFAGLEGKRLSEITAWHVEKWRAARMKEKKKLKPASVNRPLGYLKAALNRAVEWGLLDENPLSAVKPIREDPHSKVRYLEQDEHTRLMNALDEREEELRAARDRHNVWLRCRHEKEMPDLRAVAFADHMKPMIVLSLNTGLRRGEVFNLEWPDVDFERETVTIRGEVAKSGKTRHVPLNAAALDALKGWRAQNKGRGYVFESPQTGGRFNNVKRAWASILGKAKIADFRWHDMRHDFASKLVMVGADLNTVRELLGHSDIKMTLRYAHLAPRAKRAAVDQLSTQAGNIVSLRRIAENGHEA